MALRLKMTCMDIACGEFNQSLLPHPHGPLVDDGVVDASDFPSGSVSVRQLLFRQTQFLHL